MKTLGGEYVASSSSKGRNPCGSRASGNETAAHSGRWHVSRANGWCANALAAFFPTRLPESFAARFDPTKDSWGRESHIELLELLTAQPTSPGRRAFVLKTWRDVFPGDSVWLNKIPAN